MGEEILKNVLNWCFKNTNILMAKDFDNYGESFLHFATDNGYTSVVTQILAEDVSPDLEDNSNSTPLHLASQKGLTEIAEILIQNGANLNCKETHKNLTPLHISTAGGQFEMTKLLINYGANINS